jgi:hypothetical protein
MRAFVLGGGGARAAMQVGALRALDEAGVQPDLLVGTSAGGINAAYPAGPICCPITTCGSPSAACSIAADRTPSTASVTFMLGTD